MTMPLPYVPPKGAVRTAIMSVFAGMRVTCGRADWPAIRAGLVEQADEWDYLGKALVAQLARAEVARLDAWFADAAHDAATEQGVITVGSV